MPTGRDCDIQSVKRRRRRRLTAGAVVGLVAGVAAALLVRREPAGGGPTMPSEGRYGPPVAVKEAPWPLSAIGGVGGAAVADLSALPADLAMPAEASRRSLVHRRALGAEEIKAEYVAPGDVRAVGQCMDRQLGRLGWRKAWCPPPTDGIVTGVFVKAGDTLYLRLNGDRVCVKILAVIKRAC